MLAARVLRVPDGCRRRRSRGPDALRRLVGLDARGDRRARSVGLLAGGGLLSLDARLRAHSSCGRNQSTKKPTATTAAATRNTRSSVFENPTRKGMTSAGKASIALVSARMLSAPACCSAAACWAASGFVCAAWRICSGISVPSRENRIDRNTAVPSVPPIWRKNVTDDVATPISRGETAFCTARMIGCMLKPSPRPISDHEQHEGPQRGVGVDRRRTGARATTMKRRR